MRNQTNIAAPSDDKRWKLVEATMRRNGYRPDALIETLHTVQESFGYLDDESLQYVARKLRVASSQVYGVATFYHFFTLKPQGKHVCAVCTGTACYIKGAEKLIEEVHDNYGITPGQTTPDGELSLVTVRCVGACGLAPAVVLDGETHGNMKPGQMSKELETAINKTGSAEPVSHTAIPEVMPQ
ncbi:MAG: bidirectional hydrogenase complex protein HoxE [Chloroflexi bacterium]|nr:bidirectional hydrogenase complex protein HoxE [Chloroflexota bacterium]